MRSDVYVENPNYGKTTEARWLLSLRGALLSVLHPNPIRGLVWFQYPVRLPSIRFLVRIWSVHYGLLLTSDFRPGGSLIRPRVMRVICLSRTSLSLAPQPRTSRTTWHVQAFSRLSPLWSGSFSWPTPSALASSSRCIQDRFPSTRSTPRTALGIVLCLQRGDPQHPTMVIYQGQEVL